MLSVYAWAPSQHMSHRLDTGGSCGAGVILISTSVKAGGLEGRFWVAAVCRPVFSVCVWGGMEEVYVPPNWASVLCSGGNVSPETQAHKD